MCAESEASAFGGLMVHELVVFVFFSLVFSLFEGDLNSWGGRGRAGTRFAAPRLRQAVQSHTRHNDSRDELFVLGLDTVVCRS